MPTISSVMLAFDDPDPGLSIHTLPGCMDGTLSIVDVWQQLEDLLGSQAGQE